MASTLFRQVCCLLLVEAFRTTATPLWTLKHIWEAYLGRTYYSNYYHEDKLTTVQL